MTTGTVDFTLHGDNLQAWEEWLASQKEREWLLSWGIQATKAAVMVSLPLWILARLIGVVLSFLSILTMGSVFWPFHWLLIRPLTFLVAATSEVWSAFPVLRPALLILGPLVVMVGMVVISLIPDGNPDHQSARLVLCELWPLSSRRLQWIAEHGNGA